MSRNAPLRGKSECGIICGVKGAVSETQNNEREQTMGKKHYVYTRKSGNMVAVFDRPVAGQLRYTASKRVALDGKAWWSIFDNEAGDYVPGTKCKTRRECETKIMRGLKNGEFGTADKKSKKRVKKFAVDVHCDLAKCYEVEATSRDEAEEKVWKKIREILSNPTPSVIKLLAAEGFEATEDAEVNCSGEEDEDGEIQYN